MSTHDFSLESGERQVSKSWDGIRADHRFRYEWADQHIPHDGFGLDCFCGNGYGAQFLARCGRNVWAIDGSSEAIAFAQQYFPSRRVLYSARTWPFELPKASANFVVSLESIVEGPQPPVLFSLPANYRKFDPLRLIEQIKQSDVWVEPHK